MHRSPDAAERPSLRLSAPGAHVCGWCVLAVVNAIFIMSSASERSLGRALLHYLYDAGQLLALGLVDAAGIWGFAECWQRSQRLPRARLIRIGMLVLLAVLTFGSWSLILEDDLANWLSRVAEEGSALPWDWLVVGAVSALLAGVVLVVTRFESKIFKLAYLVTGALAGVANHLLVSDAYPGLRLYTAIIAATLLGAGLVGLPLPSALLRLPRLTSAVYVVAAGVGTFSVVLLPDPQTWRDVFSVPGAVLAPFVSRLHSESVELKASRHSNSPWYQERSAARTVPPSARKGLPARPIVLFLTVDALRAELFSEKKFWKYLPNLHRLKKKSVYFSHARSPSPATATTFTAIYSGKYYSATRWSRRKAQNKPGVVVWPFEEKTPRVANLLRQADVDTVNVRTHSTLSRVYGVCGGFAEEILVGHKTNAAQSKERLLGRLERQGDRPLFVATHWTDPHSPYTMGGADKLKGSEFEKYLREVKYADAELGKVLAVIQKPPFKDRTILIFASDHGEAFGEHNSRYHAGTMYEELLRVPLMIYGPGIKPRQVLASVSLMDLGPTILDLFGEPTPGWFMGQSLVPFLLGKNVKLTRPLAAEASRLMQAMLFPDGYKAIVDLRKRTEEVYDLTSDPGETKNLAQTNSRADEALNDLRLFFAAHRLHDYDPPWRQF